MTAGERSSILFITRKWPPALGGMETYSAELVRELREIGHEVEVISLPGQPNGDPPTAFAMIRFGLGASLRLMAKRGAWRVVHGGDLAVWPLAWLAALRSRGRPKVILSAHGTDVSFALGGSLARRAYRAYLAIGRIVLPATLTVISNSNATSEKLRQVGFGRVEKVALGCRVTIDASTEEDADTLLFAGRLVARKGLSWFVSAVLPHLPENLRLVVAGAEWDASETAALNDPRVTFVGPLSQPDLWARMSRALAVVIPNRASGRHQFEGFGLIAAEAAAAGGLVLASDVDGYRDSVLPGETGDLLPPDDKEAWIAAVKNLTSKTTGARRAMRLTAQDKARAHFSWSRVARETAEIYEA